MTPFCALAHRFFARGAALVLVAGVIFMGGTARAEYEFCNKTSYALRAAVGYIEGENVVTRGWWRLRAGDCKTVLSEAVTPGKYFVYAEAIPGHAGDRLRTWSGNTPLCVHDDSLFTLRDQLVCADDPRRQRAFLPVQATVTDIVDGKWETEFSDESNFTVYQAKVAGVQRLLQDVGLFRGSIDGQFGGRTRNAIAKFQSDKGLTASGRIGDALTDALIKEANAIADSRGFRMCNDTMLPISAAFAAPGEGEDEGAYVSSGWWRLDPNECAKVRRNALSEGPYYVYGVMEAERSRFVPLAGGSRSFCVSAVRFEADSDVPCEESGYEVAAFRPVDPAGESSHTFDFSPELFNPDLAGR